MEWIINVWNKVKEVFQAVGTNLDDSITKLDSINFNSNNVISNVLSNLHFLLGTPVYLMLISLLSLGIAFTIWVIVKLIISIIQNTMPKIKNRVI